jgi:hypothetical protein
MSAFIAHSVFGSDGGSALKPSGRGGLLLTADLPLFHIRGSSGLESNCSGWVGQGSLGWCRAIECGVTGNHYYGIPANSPSHAARGQ